MVYIHTYIFTNIININIYHATVMALVQVFKIQMLKS